MKRRIAMGRVALALPVLILLAGVMTGSAVADEVSPYGTLPPGVKIDPNGVLRIGFGAPPTTLDPHLVIQPTEETYNTLVYDRLTRMSADFKPVPMLATKWTFTPNDSALDLDLRQDVTFHDGTQFDATSVKASLDRAKTLPRSTSAASLTAVESVEILGKFKVRLHLAPHRGANLPYILGTAAGTIISAKAIADPARNLALDPGDAGSGPYLVTEFRPNEHVAYERAPGTPWDKGAGLVRRIEINFMVSSARLRAFETGALDFAQILGLEVSPARAFVKANHYQEQIETGTRQALYLRASRPTLSDIRVRRAIASAIDRSAINRAVFDGNCAPATQIFDKDHWAHDPGFVDFHYDPDGARAAIKEAGAVGKSIEIVAGAGTQYEQVALVVQSELKDIGLNASITPMPFGDAVAAFRTKTHDAFVFNIQAEPHPDVTYNTYFLNGYAVTPEADVPALTALLAKAQDPQTSPEEQISIYRKATDMVAEEATAIPICFSTNLYVNTNNVLFADTIRRRVGGLRDFRFFAMKAK